MNNRLMALAAAVTLAASVWAQGPRGGRGAGVGPNAARGAGLDMTKQTTVQGVVTAVNISWGTQYPSIEIDKTAVKIAPVWFLLENDFEIAVADALRVTAAPALTSDPYLHAIAIENTRTGKTITLRDGQGLPEWGGGRGRQFQREDRPRTGNGCLDLAAAVTVAGVIDKVTLGMGIRMPSVVVKTADGKLVTIVIGPERVLLENDFELNPGEWVSILAAPCAYRDELVALSITNAAGLTLKLREEDGTPAW